MGGPSRRWLLWLGPITGVGWRTTNRLADPYVYDLLWAPGETSLADIGKTMGLSDDRMRELNPQLIRGLTPPDSVYPLRVPVGQAYQAMAALAAPDRRSGRADD